ncbi:MAG: hypothetical protein GAK28_03213 [Luteibacter sp.]|uniref:hypothetical protein n=1 Tax=Luteibacter sp. TaxID=1886636 RepID=UPI00137CF009|nr:hypothetical protein [Luteibacter sp.]KAF1005461.1 MAG: hypothetical protein GAK28_03213 [Luteibacter sp.]
MIPLRIVAWAVGLSLLIAAYGAGHHVATLTGDAALSAERSAREQERTALANQRADAINARLIAEGKQADAINKAAQAYQQGKTDAVHAADQAIADLAAGNRRLRDQWATCQRTTDAVSSAAGGQRPDGADGLREDGIRRVLSAVGQCQAQRDALQQALITERISP